MFISETPQFEIHRLYAHNSLRNYTYLVLKKATREVTIVDPWDAQACLDYLIPLRVSQIFVVNTHLHHDHIRGNSGLLAAGAMALLPAEFEAWPLPGHTCEHVVFFLKDQSAHLFCGDTLFQAGVGNCKNGGDPQALFESIQWLKRNLSPETVLHVGHDYLKKNLQFAQQFELQNPRIQQFLDRLKDLQGFELPPHTWAIELDINPFLRLSETGIRQELKGLDIADSSELLNDRDVFIKLRSLRDNF
jgi:hydroxyacylglutathione hydrolase